MSAQATFFYGVFIKSAYLCFASDAYKEFKTSLLAIDLICARRRKGILAVKGNSGTVGRVPEEVWKMIKLEIVDEGMEEAEQRVIGDFWDSGCPCCCDNRIAPSNWEKVVLRLQEAMESFWEYGGVARMVSSRSKEIKVLLDDFGLALPRCDVYSTEEDSEFDPLASSPISLPIRSTGSTTASTAFPKVETECSETGPVHQILQFSKQALKLPHDADQRIKRFLSFFRLEPMNPESETVYRPRKPKEPESKPRKVTHKSRCCPDPETEPHWHLWGVSHYY